MRLLLHSRKQERISQHHRCQMAMYISWMFVLRRRAEEAFRFWWTGNRRTFGWAASQYSFWSRVRREKKRKTRPKQIHVTVSLFGTGIERLCIMPWLYLDRMNVQFCWQNTHDVPDNLHRAERKFTIDDKIEKPSQDVGFVYWSVQRDSFVNVLYV